MDLEEIKTNIYQRDCANCLCLSTNDIEEIKSNSFFLHAEIYAKDLSFSMKKTIPIEYRNLIRSYSSVYIMFKKDLSTGKLLISLKTNFESIFKLQIFFFSKPISDMHVPKFDETNDIDINLFKVFQLFDIKY
jgi:hypothetical protein